MKKTLLLLPLAAMLLTGCGGSSGKKGAGTKEEQAIEKAKTYDLATVNGSGAIFEDDPVNIGWESGHYHNDFLCLTNEVNITDKDTGTKYTVNVAWEYDKSTSFIQQVLPVDDNHTGVYFTYDENKTQDFPFKATLTCGSAAAVEMNFKVQLQTKNVKFDHYSIQELYALNSDGNDFELVDHETGYYTANNDPNIMKYACVSTEGKVLYISPDGNWALIGDGDYTLELYAGGALDLKPSRYPALKVGEVVYVETELGSYYGNLQVNFIFDITAGDASKITEPTGYKPMVGTDFDGKHYYEGGAVGLMNGMREINAVYVGNPQQKSGEDEKAPVTDVSKIRNYRFTVEVTVDGVSMRVAYDYHIDVKGELGFFDAFKAKVGTWQAGDHIKFKGTVRFVGDTANGYKDNQDDTYWSIVPLETSHISGTW